MAYIATKSKFHLALNGVGLMLQGAPDRLAYQQSQAPVYGQRFANGDRDYNDLSAWWYFIQTDWSGGAKDTFSWSDDAKFYYSTNIDVWGEPGAIKLTREQYPAGSGGDNDFTYNVICGFEGEVNGSVKKFVGLSDDAGGRPRIWSANPGEAQSWSDVSGTAIGTNQATISQMSARSDILIVSTTGAGTTWVVLTWNGTTWTDQSANLYNGGATISFQPASSRAHANYLGTTYVLVDDASNNKYAMVKTSVALPAGTGDWSKAFETLNSNGLPIAACGYNGGIYYLVDYTYYCELWCYDIVAATNVLVRKFNNSTLESYGVGDKLMVELNGKLIITIPSNEIWELNGTALTRIYNKIEAKRLSTSSEFSVQLRYGAVIQDDKAWWGNLMYDGANFFNTWKSDTDSANDRGYPLFADSTMRIWESHDSDQSVIWSVNLNGSLYKGAADKNYLVFSNVDNLSGIEKLAYSVTLLFKPFTTNQKITVEYLLGEFSTSASWTLFATASAALDGTTVSSKTFFFANGGLIFNKIWFRIKLEGGGSDTPALRDFVMEYLPMPSYKKLWNINVNCGEDVKGLAGSLLETTGRELKSLIEQAWWTKSTLDFQDLDYATTTVADNPLSASNATITVPNGGTTDFPEQGRLKIENEEIFYTGKTPTTFTGCTRGARGTRAVEHVLSTAINNAYKVMVTDVGTRVPIALQDKRLEYITSISLREV